MLEQYLKKSKASTLKSASSGLSTNVVPPPTTSSIGDLMESVVGSPPPAMPTGSYFKSDYASGSHLIRPQAAASSGFSPYYSSPKYSTPPLPSSESMLGSPIPDFSQKFYHQYDQAPGSQPHSLTSVSPTSGVRILSWKKYFLKLCFFEKVYFLKQNVQCSEEEHIYSK